jgi:LmbE family N-acetylglucosaminyl deacetylase
MCITAHPDDESAGFGGALMQAHERGAETQVICLTAGQAASHRGEFASDEDLARQRRKEFAAALRVLQVDHGEVLNYPDGKLAQQNFCEAVAALVERIRSFRPQVVLTFAGDGSVNRHPDHTMVSMFATTAFHWSGRNPCPGQIASNLPPYSPQKLYYVAPPFLLGDPETVRKIACVPASLVLDVRDWKAKKHEAFRQHITQLPILERARANFDQYAGEERYLLAAARGLRPALAETDMFAGVEED